MYEQFLPVMFLVAGFLFSWMFHGHSCPTKTQLTLSKSLFLQDFETCLCSRDSSSTCTASLVSSLVAGVQIYTWRKLHVEGVHMDEFKVTSLEVIHQQKRNSVVQAS